MPSPVEAIAAEGAQAVASEIAPPVAQSFLSSAWAKLRAPSPRTDVELSDDMVSQLLNGILDARTGGAASPAKMGEAVADCAYALTDLDGSPGATSPLGRLFKATKTMVGGMMRRAKEAGAQRQ